MNTRKTILHSIDSEMPLNSRYIIKLTHHQRRKKKLDLKMNYHLVYRYCKKNPHISNVLSRCLGDAACVS